MQFGLEALFPLILTLFLALTLKRTLVALGVGIVSGALLIQGFSPIATMEYLANSAVSQIYTGGQWQLWHLDVLAAMALLGMITKLLSRGGAVEVFALWLNSRVRSHRQARLGVVFLGWIVFIDGIFSCLAVGNVCKPLGRKYGVRSEQLAYLVDSNASPLCAVLPFSSWGPYVMALLAGITLLPISPIEALLQMAQINFYAITTIILSLLVAWYGTGFKPLEVTPVVHNEKSVSEGSPWLLGLPMLSLLLLSVLFILYSGGDQSQGRDLMSWLANADIGASMRNACVIATVITVVMLKRYGRSWKALGKDMLFGMQTIALAVAILLFTWMIGGVIKDLGVAKMLAAWAELYLSAHLLLPDMFFLCAIMAFTTGSSWGTFAIMIPIGSEIALAVDMSLLIPALSAVMAGSVFGDHCSPISDTSVLSAISSGCEPHDHVVTQLPFAMIAAISAVIGYGLLNIGVPVLATWSAVLVSVLGLFYVKDRKLTLLVTN